MKSLISILVLFFSFSSLAGDDLKDRAVFCYDEVKDLTNYHLDAYGFGIEFISENEAIIYYEKNKGYTEESYKPRYSQRTYYRITPHSVSVTDLNGKDVLLINRHDLEIEVFPEKVGTTIIYHRSWKNYHCEITHPKELLKLFDDRFKKFKDNLL